MRDRIPTEVQRQSHFFGLMEFKATQWCKLYSHAIKLHQFSCFMLKQNTLLNILKAELFVTEQIEDRENYAVS